MNFCDGVIISTASRHLCGFSSVLVRLIKANSVFNNTPYFPSARTPSTF